MPKTKIEWCDYTINPVKGLCPMACPYCYARRMYLNPYYKSMYQHPEVRWYPPAFDLLDTLKKPSRIFVGSTFELFLDSLPENWMDYNLRTAERYPHHTFIFLTKQPQNLPKFADKDGRFPDNCWVGATITNDAMMPEVVKAFDNIWASMKFISFEPCLGRLSKESLKQIRDYLCQWVIIGAQTKPTVMPKIEWVKEIVEAADKAGIPVFLKDNLNPLFAQNGCEYFTKYRDLMFSFKDFEPRGTRCHLRQEMPEWLKL